MKSEYYVGPDPRAQQQAMAKAAIRNELLARQNVVLAIVGGLIGAIVGAVLWAVVTVVTQFQIGFMALGVGWLVGQLTWRFGRGLSSSYGIVGAVLAFLGCVIGNVLSACYFAAQGFAEDPEFTVTVSQAFWTLAGSFNFGLYWELLTVTFSPVDILFYVFALYVGWRFSFRKLAI